jgi:DNA-binding winged helix-turn-helix (wHTH) protein
MSELPSLRYRLPKPAPGAYRAPEVIAALTHGLESGDECVTIVHGEPCSGRSCALMMALATRVERPVYIVLNRRDHDDVLVRLYHALQLEGDVAELAWRDPQARILEVLERCEQLELCVVVDAPWQTASLHLLVDCVMRYARRSRWVVMMDTLPWRAHMLNVVEVPSPTPEEYEAWLERVTPRWTASRRAALISEHAGAGFRELERALVLLESPLLEMSERQLALCNELDALSAPAQELWMTHPEVSAELRVLESYGGLHRRATGRWQLTPMVVDLLSHHVDAAQASWQRPLHHALQQMPKEPHAGFVSFELAMQRVDYDVALELLAAYFDAWVERGWLHILWGHISDSDKPLAPGFERYKIQCALITLGSEHLDALYAPMATGSCTQLLWMNVLVERGEIARARDIFDVHRDALGEHVARLYEVLLDLNEGAFLIALERCEHMDRAGLEPAQEFLLDSMYVLALTWARRQPEALEHAHALRITMGAQVEPHHLIRHAWVNLARSLHLCGNVTLAHHALTQAATHPVYYDDPFLSFHSHASVEYLKALLHVQTLELKHAERLLEPLSIRYSTSYVLGFHVHQLLVAISLKRDDYEGVMERVEHIRQLHRHEHEPWDVLHLYHARAISEQRGFVHTTHMTMTTQAHMGRDMNFDLERALRLEGLACLTPWCEEHGVSQETACADILVMSLVELYRAEEDAPCYDRMIDALVSQREQAEQGHDAIFVCVLERRHALYALYHGRADSLDLWRCVEASAIRYDNHVWRESAAFILRLYQPEGLSCEALLGWRGRLPLSMMRRVCEGILGAYLPDRVERRCAAVLAAKLTWRSERGSLDRQMPELWLDLHQGVLCSLVKSVALPSRGSQRKLIQVLAAQPGLPHTKEQLLERVWGIDAFHPLKHENRLRMAIFKLRKLVEQLVEDTSNAPTFIVTRDDGYILSDNVSVVRVV